MRRFLFGLGVLVLVGCAPPPPPVPIPTFPTPEGKVCARQCQQMRTQCELPCADLPPVFGAASRCLQRCAQHLGECYATCE